MNVGPSAANTESMAEKSLLPTHTPVMSAPSSLAWSASAGREAKACRGREAGGGLGGIGGQVAEGLQVAEVGRGPGLQRGRPTAGIGEELEAGAPQGVGGRIGVVGQDV